MKRELSKEEIIEKYYGGIPVLPSKRVPLNIASKANWNGKSLRKNTLWHRSK